MLLYLLRVEREIERARSIKIIAPPFLSRIARVRSNYYVGVALAHAQRTRIHVHVHALCALRISQNFRGENFRGWF